MKKIILVASVLLLVVSSCTPNADDPITPEKKLIKVTSRSYDTNNQLFSTVIENFVYNNNVLVKVWGTKSDTGGTSNVEETFTYTNGKLTQYKDFTSNPNSSLQYTEDYTYSGDDIISTVHTYTGNNSINTGNSQYTYTSGNMTGKKYSQSGNLLYDHTYTYSAQGNLLKMIDTPSNTTLTEYLTYDTKNNPYYKAYPVVYSKIKFVTPNNVLTSTNPNYTNSYVYNSEGYVTKRTYSYSPSSYSIVEYEYEP